jgi:hypothetical protein
MRIGAGMRTLVDNAETNIGWNVTYGGDLFLAKPFVLTTTIDFGQIEQASVFESRSTIGVLLNRVEVFTGYEFLKIGGTKLHGLIGGLRVWF